MKDSPNSHQDLDVQGENAGSDMLDLRKRKSMLERVFLFNFQLYKVEEVLCTSLFTKGFLAAYFLITGISITEWGLLNNKHLQDITNPFDTATRIGIVLFYTCLITMLVLGVFRPLKVNSQPTLFDYLVVWGKFLHIYVVLPVCFWLFSGELFDWGNTSSGVSTLQLTFTWIILPVGLVLCWGFLELRNTLPSGSRFSALHKSTKFGLHLLISILAATQNTLQGTSAEFGWSIANLVISTIHLIYCYYVQLFWHYSINLAYIQLASVTFAARLSIWILQFSPRPASLMETAFYVLISACFSVKIARNFLDSNTKGKIKGLAVETPAHIFGVLIQYSLVLQDRTDHSNNSEVSPSLLFKFSLIGELLKKNKQILSIQVRNLNDGMSQVREVDALDYFQRVFISTKAKNKQALYIQLILQILFIEQNLLKFSVNLANYKKSVGDSTWGLLSYYLLEALIRGRLTTLASSNNQQTAYFKTNVFSEIFRELSGNSNISSEQPTHHKKTGPKSSSCELPSLGAPLSWKNTILNIMSSVSSFQNTKSDLFSSFLTSRNAKTEFLYQANQRCLSRAKHIDLQMEKAVVDPSIPKFGLLLSSCYFLKVRHDAEKAEKIFRMYQSRVSRLLHNPSIFGKEINETNFLYSSVVMKIDVSSDLTLGMIKDITPNYREHLGEPEEGDPTRVNINSLFPGSMSAAHAKMMRATDDQQIFNRQREFQINGFDGHLRPLSFVLKLDSTVSGGLHALALLRFPEDGRSHLALANEQLELTTAQNQFWHRMGKIEINQATGEYLTEDLQGGENVINICPSLVAQIKFFEFLRTEAPQSDSLINNRLQLNMSGTVVDGIADLHGGQQVSENQVGGEHYSYSRLKQRVLELSSVLEKSGIKHKFYPKGISSKDLDESKFTPALIKVEKSHFGEETYYRIWVTFDLNYNKEARKVNQSTGFITSRETQAVTGSYLKLNTFERMLEKGVSPDHQSESQSSEIDDEGLGLEEFALVDNQDMERSTSFETMLRRLRTASPIVSLVSEALGKNYPPEIKAALNWIQEFYKASEAAGKQYQEYNQDYIKQSEAINTPVFDSKKMPGKYPPPKANMVTLEVFDEFKNPTGYRHSKSFNQSVDKPSSFALSSLSQIPRETTFGEDRCESNRDHNIHHQASRNIVKPSQIKFESQDDIVTHGYTKDLNRIIPSTKTSKILPPVNKGFRSMAEMPSKKPQAILFHKTKKSKLPQNNQDTHLLKSPSKSEAHPKDLGSRQTIAPLKPNRETLDHLKHKLRPGRLTPSQLEKLSAPHAFMSSSETRVKAINDKLADVKGNKKIDFGDPDKNASVSASSQVSSSRGAHLLKYVRATMESSKSAAFVYQLVIGTIFFSVFFICAGEYIFNSLLVYNSSNTNNYVLVSQFLFLDRKVIQAAEIQTMTFAHIDAITNKTAYDLGVEAYRPVLPPGMNSTEYLFGRLHEARDSLLDTMQKIVETVTEVIDPKDAPLANEAVYRASPMLYVDRFTNLSSIYKPWVVTYFNSIYYYVDLVTENLHIMMAFNELGLRTNFKVVFQSNDTEKFTKLSNSRFGRDSTIFGSSTLKEMVHLFDKVVDDIIVSAVDRHFNPIYVLFYITAAVLAMMLSYNVLIAYKINEIQKDLLSNYSLLKPWEILHIHQECERQTIIFSKMIFNEQQLISEYFDFGVNGQQSSLNMSLNKLQEKFSKEKDKVSGGLKITHNFYFFSVQFSFFSWLISAGMFAVIAISITDFLSINDQRIGAEMLIFTSHKLLLGVTKNYISLLLLTIYGNFLPIAGSAMQDDLFESAIDTFLIFQTSKRRDFISYFGKDRAVSIDEMAFGDICGQMTASEAMAKYAGRFTDICRTINQGSAKKGIVGFLQYQKQFISSAKAGIRKQFRQFLEESKTKRPEHAIMSELFSHSFVEMRVSNWMVYNTYYSLMNEIVTSVVQEIKEQLDRFVGQIMQYISLGLYLVLLISYFYLFRAQAEELDICYETFKLIDPYFLMSNRYLQHKFKSAFKGVE